MNINRYDTDKFIVAIDYDNTIVEKSDKLIEIGKPKKGAIEAIKKLKDNGCYIIIWSGRNNKIINDDELLRRLYLFVMKFTLDLYGIPYDEIDYGVEGKVVADVYLDDRGLEFKDNWEEVVQAILYKKDIEHSVLRD